MATTAQEGWDCFSDSYLGRVINGLSIRCQQYTQSLLTLKEEYALRTNPCLAMREEGSDVGSGTRAAADDMVGDATDEWGYPI